MIVHRVVYMILSYSITHLFVPPLLRSRKEVTSRTDRTLFVSHWEEPGDLYEFLSILVERIYWIFKWMDFRPSIWFTEKFSKNVLLKSPTDNLRSNKYTSRSTYIYNKTKSSTSVTENVNKKDGRLGSHVFWHRVFDIDSLKKNFSSYLSTFY